MRNRARLRSTHYSAWIEGNRLILAEAERILAGLAHYQFVTIHPL
jgi:Fic family protein